MEMVAVSDARVKMAHSVVISMGLALVLLVGKE